MTRRGLFGLLTGLLVNRGFTKATPVHSDPPAHGAYQWRESDIGVHVDGVFHTECKAWISVNGYYEQYAGKIGCDFPRHFFPLRGYGNIKSVRVRFESDSNAPFKLYSYRVGPLFDD